MISSRTPEGEPNRCPVCGRRLRLEPSTVPTADAPCPHCGSLVWFAPADAAGPPDPEALLDRLSQLGRASAVGASRLVADFSDVRMMDSAVLGRLITLHRRCQRMGRRLAVRGLRPEVREVFRLTKLDRVLDVEDDDDQGAG